ncbi:MULTISPECIES: DUF72 domain-containing protein [unclassified Pseudomonas]|uniref:DUF72 domain-containing protein n=1 Tax=unclassified Pseudomonas TaxID=196821 RepID=UPI002AC94071|nr:MULTISPECIES: DUF72 domain-containing protein [unclassified Pseudomonas]MEB0041035.1 DUF72 domain-containing protein [Pseudomonas sp. MH10]MEB0076628.1 DUF72 domain-containing protein [Pseudomonas sp. MH10out]MEB0090441.1 DUF72 domain-containing protein [Pseudomonas sp. CCI4.2]MEB0100716.1 DUF72 domain-containing protein [Pseudomonas sp. CCI3.2]MEB0120845.1 DUF72 domain-containing protein [Pseudomonas sp. CCI1.2]
MNPAPQVYIGCAGWSLPRQSWPAFCTQGTHLQRYASQLNAVEINSSFYRPHAPKTYARWGQSVAPAFRFSVKLPKLITHEKRLRECERLLDDFLAQCTELGGTLGCLLIQLPASFVFDEGIARVFFGALRERYTGFAVLEPRHESWREAEDVLVGFKIGRVAADPSPIAGGNLLSGWTGIRYWRMHGSPRMYYSNYDDDRLSALALELQHSAQDSVPNWCIFDNTAQGAAIGNALALKALMRLTLVSTDNPDTQL